MDLNVLKDLTIATPSKIVLMVMDGLGGFPSGPGGKTELETARTPNFDRLAAGGMVGFHQPVGPGIIPGSGPSHLGVFGYDPIQFDIGRGVLEALGIEFDLQPADLAARGNFCSVDSEGRITDRRAGRIATEITVRLCDKLRAIAIPGVEVFVEPVRDYRFVLVLRGNGLHDDLTETDPQREGLHPLPVTARTDAAKPSADLVNEFIAKAKEILKDEHPANMLLLRGFSKRPDMPTFRDVYKLRAAAIAVYPMYRGLAKLVGMDVVPTGTTVEDEFNTLRERWNDFDFFFVHFKKTDSAGEDGDFDRKVAAIEEVDAGAAALFDLNPDVVIVTGDHSTPAALKSHSWHPVPVCFSAKWARPDHIGEFGEDACRRGGLGTIPAVNLMPLALAHALKMTKYGA